MNRKLFILTIKMLGWKEVNINMYSKNKVYVFVDNPYLQVRGKHGTKSFAKYEDMFNWITKK